MHLILVGAPGSGKGTCAQDLKKVFAIPHISTGEMFRKAIKEGSELGKLAQSLIDKGNFVPDDITNRLVKQRLTEADCENGFLLDGYPRNLEQAHAFEQILKELNIKLDAVINLDIEEENVINRIVNRRMCSNCGAGYNVVTNPSKVEGICDKCGSPLYVRADDNEETVRQRLTVYNEQTKPLIEYYEKQNLLINVDANQIVEKVVSDITNLLEAKCFH